MDQAAKHVRGLTTKAENLNLAKKTSKLELGYQITDNRDKISKLKLGFFGTKTKSVLYIFQVRASGVDN